MASKIPDEVLAANAEYVATFGKKGELALPPARRFAILTCINARLDAAKYAGLSEGDAHVIRNAGGRASDDAIMADLLDDSLAIASFDGKTWSNPQHGGGCIAGHFIKWHTIAKQEDSVLHDVRRIREHPLVPSDIPIYGYVYDVKTGRLNEVAQATEAGRDA